jgi:hypothetical protein
MQVSESVIEVVYQATQAQQAAAQMARAEAANSATVTHT